MLAYYVQVILVETFSIDPVVLHSYHLVENPHIRIRYEYWEARTVGGEI